VSEEAIDFIKKHAGGTGSFVRVEE